MMQRSGPSRSPHFGFDTWPARGRLACAALLVAACSDPARVTPRVNECVDALLCEDFESYAVGDTPSGSWSTRQKSGAVSVDSKRARSGSRAAKLSTEAGSATKTAMLRVGAPALPTADNVFYGRLMFYLEAAPTASVHWTLVQAGGLVPGQDYHALYRYGGQLPITSGQDFVGSQWMANYETPDSYQGTGPSSDCWSHANGHVVPVAKWSCFEWEFDGPNNQMRAWLDGTALDDLSVSNTGQGCVHQGSDFPWTAPNFEQLDVGWESYQADDARTLYLDDVVVASHPIGCPH
jgi:hypothetical protein